MAGHPINDQIKIKVDADAFGFGGQKKGVETGVVVELPVNMMYFGFHNFGFDTSLDNDGALQHLLDYYQQLLNTRVFWESLQDRGRRFKEGNEEFVYIKMSDILFYSDNVDDDIQLALDQGGFNPA